MYAVRDYVVASIPTPYGDWPLMWYQDGGGLFTAFLIFVGVLVTVAAVIGSLHAWWGSFGLYLLANIFFAFMTAGSAVGCKREGCELAQTFAIAYTWYAVIFAIGLGIFALTLIAHVAFGIADIVSPVRLHWRKLSVEWKFYILAVPGFLTIIMPMAYAVLAGILFANSGPFEMVRSMMHDPVWVSIWALSFLVMVPGLWIVVKDEWSREFGYR